MSEDRRPGAKAPAQVLHERSASLDRLEDLIAERRREADEAWMQEMEAFQVQRERLGRNRRLWAHSRAVTEAMLDLRLATGVALTVAIVAGIASAIVRIARTLDHVPLVAIAAAAQVLAVLVLVVGVAAWRFGAFERSDLEVGFLHRAFQVPHGEEGQDAEREQHSIDA
jgi:hypothetical protein